MLFDGNVPVRFRAQQRAKHSSLQLTANSIAAIRCPPILWSNWFENHQLQRKQISTVGNVPYIQSSNHGLQCYTQPLVFRTYSFNSCNIQSNIQAFRLTRLFWWQKLTWIFFGIFLNMTNWTLSDFAVQFWLRCKFHEKPFESSMTVAWFFVDQSQFFATHSNQWDCFILYRRQIRSNGSFRVRRSGQGASSESQRKLVGAGRKSKRARKNSDGEKSRTRERVPGDKVLTDQFETVGIALASDWCQKTFVFFCPITEQQE